MLDEAVDQWPDREAIVYSAYDDMGIAARWTFAGTHTAPLSLPDGRELAPTGMRIEIRGMEYCLMRDGKLVVNTLYYDNVAVAAQLGLLPELAIA